MRHVPSRKGRTIALSIVAVLVAVLGLGVWNFSRPLPAVIVHQEALAAAASDGTALAWPSAGEAAVEVKGVTNTLTYGEQKALPTASIAKVITALTVLQAKPMEAGDLGPTITLTQADVDIYNNYVAQDGSVVHVAPGEQLTEYQALQALMLPSANNIADTLAIWAFGSLDAYHTAATEYVQQLGMTATTIGTDASGLAASTASTPTDLIRLGEAAMAHPVLSEIVGQTSATLPVEGKVYNVNGALGSSGIVGIKTGNIDEVGGNLLFAAKHDVDGKTVTIIGVVMGQSQLSAALQAAPALIDSITANLYTAAPVKAGQTIATFSTAWGTTAKAVAKKDISFIAWKGETLAPKISLQKTGVSYSIGATVGNVSATAGTNSGSVDVVMESTLEEPTFWWRLTRH